MSRLRDSSDPHHRRRHHRGDAGTAAGRPVLRVRGPVDLLAVVPRMLGFHPDGSVVMLTLGSAAEPFHARVDLPTDPVGIEAVAGQLAGVAVRHAVEQVALVLYTPDAGLAEALCTELGRRLHAGGVEVLCRLRAHAQRWWDLDRDAAGRGTDDPGSPYDVSTHPITAQAVLEGRVVLRSREALADSLVGDDLAETRRVAELGDSLLGRLAGPSPGAAGGHRLEHEARWLRRRVARFLVDGERLDTHDVARVAVLVSAVVGLRDVAWTEMTRADAGRHVDLWRDVVRRVPVALRAAPAALLGFAAWLSGDGALAWCAVERALEAEPGHGLAGLVAQALDGAVPPSTWTPVPRDRLPPYAR
jgi:uncharacterized protein DUF4192